MTFLMEVTSAERVTPATPRVGTKRNGRRSGRPGGPVGGAPVDPMSLTREIVRDMPGVVALPARGHAMRDALVNDGDVVLLQVGANLRDGELAAVRVDPESPIVLRRIYFEGDRVKLQPENRQMDAHTVGRADMVVQGRVLAIVRQQPAG